MSESPRTRQDITRLLVASRQGEAEAFDRLIALTYAELRRIARRQLARQSKEATLDTTALVHEAYLKLVDETGVDWQDRGHFFAIAARTMRRILVDQARRRTASKRGGGQVAVTLETGEISIEGQAEVVLAIDRALEELAEWNARLAKVVECRYFAGLSDAETAQALDVSTRTVERDWVRARAWLAEYLQ